MCGAHQGLIRKYDMNVCRRCFRENHALIGFGKVIMLIIGSTVESDTISILLTLQISLSTAAHTQIHFQYFI